VRRRRRLKVYVVTIQTMSGADGELGGCERGWWGRRRHMHKQHQSCDFLIHTHLSCLRHATRIRPLSICDSSTSSHRRDNLWQPQSQPQLCGSRRPITMQGGRIWPWLRARDIGYRASQASQEHCKTMPFLVDHEQRNIIQALSREAKYRYFYTPCPSHRHVRHQMLSIVLLQT